MDSDIDASPGRLITRSRQRRRKRHLTAYSRSPGRPLTSRVSSPNVRAPSAAWPSTLREVPTRVHAQNLLNEEASGMTETADTVFLFDVDNTLLDNDRVHADLGVHL